MKIQSEGERGEGGGGGGGRNTPFSVGFLSNLSGLSAPRDFQAGMLLAKA